MTLPNLKHNRLSFPDICSGLPIFLGLIGPLIGTVNDANLQSWSVQYALVKDIDTGNVAAISPAYHTIASGTAIVADARVAVFDPTVLANGTYFVRIIATNHNGNTNAQGVILNVGGQLKLGRFFYSVTDLNIPLAG